MFDKAYEYGATKALFDAGLVKEAGLRASWKSLKGLNTAVEDMLSGKANAVAESAKKIQIPNKGSPLRKATAAAESANRAAEQFIR